MQIAPATRAPAPAPAPPAGAAAPPPRRSRAALLAEIARVCFMLGATGFGGNYQARVVRAAEQHGWLGEDELERLLTTAALVPGGNTTNFKVQVAYRTAGGAGVLVGLLATFLPGLVVVIGLSSLYDLVADSGAVGAALRGMEAAVVAMVAWVAWKMLRGRLKDPRPRWLLGVDAAITAGVLAGLLLGAGFLVMVPAGIATGIAVRLTAGRVARHGPGAGA